MKLIFHFPPDSWKFAITMWVVSLVFVKWIYDLFSNRRKGITIAKLFTMKKLPFFIYPGKATKEQIEKILHKSVIGVDYIYGNRLIIWIVIFSLAWLFVFLMGFVELQDLR